MSLFRSEEKIAAIREACQIAATVLHKMKAAAVAGITTYDLDQLGRREMEALGAKSACFNYDPGSSINPFPAHTCISVNEEVVHGIGDIRRFLKEGDVLSLDVVVDYRGFIGDNALTIIIGDGKPEHIHLVDSTKIALEKAIRAARSGKRVGDVSHAVESFIKKQKLGIVRDFVGHGVGESMHEAPQIPNFGRARSGPRLQAGMTVAIEPMITLGSPKIEMLSDGWTAVTRDRKPAAHFEHTILITEDGAEILTIPNI